MSTFLRRQFNPLLRSSSYCPIYVLWYHLTRSTLSGLRVVGFYYLCVEVSYVTDWLEFAVEEPSSCSKRWSTWMVVVLCESPEFLLSVRSGALGDHPSLYRGLFFTSFVKMFSFFYCRYPCHFNY